MLCLITVLSGIMNPVIYIPQSKRLMEQLCEVLRYKDYSLKTGQAYCYWVRAAPLNARAPAR